MSAKARFFKKIQQPHSVLDDGTVEADILTFSQEMVTLSQQVHQWFEGSGVEVLVSSQHLQDLSTLGRSLNNGVSRYAITTITLQNGRRSVSILPERLYHGEDKGCVTMTVDAPDGVIGKQRFYLCMAPENGWLIRKEHLYPTGKVFMTEEIFFQAIENLA